MESEDLLFLNMMEKWKGRRKDEGRALEEGVSRRKEGEMRLKDKKAERKRDELEKKIISDDETRRRDEREREMRTEEEEKRSVSLKHQPQVKYWKDLSVTIYISGKLLGEEKENMEEVEEKGVEKTMKEAEVDEEGGDLYTEIVETEEDRRAEERFHHMALPPPLPPRGRPTNSFRYLGFSAKAFINIYKHL